MAFGCIRWTKSKHSKSKFFSELPGKPVGLIGHWWKTSLLECISFGKATSSCLWARKRHGRVSPQTQQWKHGVTLLGPCHLKFLLAVECLSTLPFTFIEFEFQFLQLTSRCIIFTLLITKRQQFLLLLNFRTLFFPVNTDLIVGK